MDTIVCYEYELCVKTLPDGLFRSPEDAWALLQAVVLGYDAMVDVSDGDVREELIKNWLIGVLPPKLLSKRLFHSGYISPPRDKMIRDAYVEAVRQSVSLRENSYVLIGGSLSYAQEWLSPINPGPVVRINADPANGWSKPQLRLLGLCDHPSPRLSLDYEPEWLRTFKEQVKLTEEAALLVSALFDMKYGDVLPYYCQQRPTGKNWRHYLKWCYAWAKACGRPQITRADLFALRFFQELNWPALLHESDLSKRIAKLEPTQAHVAASFFADFKVRYSQS